MKYYMRITKDVFQDWFDKDDSMKPVEKPETVTVEIEAGDLKQAFAKALKKEFPEVGNPKSNEFQIYKDGKGQKAMYVDFQVKDGSRYKTATVQDIKDWQGGKKDGFVVQYKAEVYSGDSVDLFDFK